MNDLEKYWNSFMGVSEKTTEKTTTKPDTKTNWIFGIVILLVVATIGGIIYSVSKKQS